MITHIRLDGQAAFGSRSPIFGPLARVNFVHGPNGSGKTSISRQFTDLARNADLATWLGTERHDVRVFNRDYVDKTFSPERDLEGVFVLGEPSAEAQAERERLKDKREKLKGKIEKLAAVLGSTTPESGKRGEMAAARRALANAAWSEKQKLATDFNTFFAGFNGTREALLNEVLRVRAERVATRPTEPTSSEGPAQAPALVTYEDLVARLTVLSDDQPDELRPLELPANFHNGSMPTSDLMAKPIVGRSDVSVAALIERLGNSDWVAAGQAHLSHSDGHCPFCQQTLPKNFADRLTEYFDRGFEEDLAALAAYESRVEEFLKAVEEIVTTLTELPVSVSAAPIDPALARAVEGQIRDVRAALRSKRESPSEVIEPADASATWTSLQQAVVETNALIQERLDLIANKKSELASLRTDVWGYLVDSALSGAFVVYDATSAPLEQAISTLTAKHHEARHKLADVEARVHEVSRSTISSAPVIERINSMLKAVGFTTFKLIPSDDLDDGYRFVRDSGEVVGHTLSEGERSFVTFLYFANQIEGLQPDLGLAPETTVVVDDPISSLDSDALFFVSTYLRELLRKMTADTTTVKQIVVLTHNVYFHKELTYKAETFCGDSHVRYFSIAKRSSDGNEILLHDKNPISTAYAGLWRMVKDSSEGADVPGVQNAMRRIVESYFEFVGRPVLTELPDDFSETDRMICRSLISWTHDGSHSTSLLDAIDYSHAGSSTEQWHTVFERLFILTNHADHFTAMMQ